MARLIRTLVAEDNMKFDDIRSFKTENFSGVWVWSRNITAFILIENLGSEFKIQPIPPCNTLEDLDNAVLDLCGEHVEEVFKSCAYTFILEAGKSHEQASGVYCAVH